jgi:hypothetical protein
MFMTVRRPGNSLNSMVPWDGAATNACAAQSFDVAGAIRKHCARTDNTRWRATGSERKRQQSGAATQSRYSLTKLLAMSEVRRTATAKQDGVVGQDRPDQERSVAGKRAHEAIGDGISSSEKAGKDRGGKEDRKMRRERTPTGTANCGVCHWLRKVESNSGTAP